MQTATLTTRYSYYRPMTETLKKQIHRRCLKISGKTALGFAMRQFAIAEEIKTDEDYHELLNDLYTDLHDGPQLMRQVLGEHFYFFRQLLF